MDKNELESLLVKLKLGTISIDDTIEEFQTYFSKKDDEVFSATIPSILQNYHSVSSRGIEYIHNEICKLLTHKEDFIFTSLSLEDISVLSSSFKNIVTNIDAATIYSLNNSIDNIDRSVMILSSKKIDRKIISETGLLFELIGCSVDVITDIDTKLITKSRSRLNNSDIVVMITNKDYLSVCCLSEISLKPVIIIPIGDNLIHHMKDINGVVYTENNSPLSAVLFAYKIFNMNKNYE